MRYRERRLSLLSTGKAGGMGYGHSRTGILAGPNYELDKDGPSTGKHG